MSAELLRPFQDLLTRISEIPNGGLDAWIYFLAAGLAFAFVERPSEATESILARVQTELDAKESPDVAFEGDQIIEIAIKTFHGLDALKLPLDAMEMIGFNTVQVAKFTLPEGTVGGYPHRTDLYRELKRRKAQVEGRKSPVRPSDVPHYRAQQLWT